MRGPHGVGAPVLQQPTLMRSSLPASPPRYTHARTLPRRWRGVRRWPPQLHLLASTLDTTAGGFGIQACRNPRRCATSGAVNIIPQQQNAHPAARTSAYDNSRTRATDVRGCEGKDVGGRDQTMAQGSRQRRRRHAAKDGACSPTEWVLSELEIRGPRRSGGDLRPLLYSPALPSKVGLNENSIIDAAKKPHAVADRGYGSHCPPCHSRQAPGRRSNGCAILAAGRSATAAAGWRSARLLGTRGTAGSRSTDAAAAALG